AAIGSVPLLFVALLVYGAGTATNLQARYAGSDLAAPSARGTAVSVALVSTTVGAVAGPNLVAPMGSVAVALGIPALAGPFLLAAAVRAPVLLFFGVCTGPRRYELRFEPLAAALDVPPSERAAAVDRAVACYACRLAELARAHPFQWFNFYDLWDSSSRGAASSDRPPRRRRRRKIPAGDRTWDADADIRPAATVAVVRPAAVAGPGPGC
ncbi:MAG: hypothetical protein KGL52_15155, partial [Rhodospirillales bacterium]|nr:hypothetical protein [Rhodospirillales bacterium]